MMPGIWTSGDRAFSPTTMTVFEQIDSVAKAATDELSAVSSADALEQFRIKYLGTKGAVKNLMTLLGQVPREEKPAIGQRVNSLKDELTAAFEVRKSALAGGAASGPVEDVTVPGLRPSLGNRHIMMKVVAELAELFGRMGFAVAEGPELEDEFHNFIALNIPPSHPARDPLDNFYIVPGEQSAGSGQQAAGSNSALEQGLLLRTQTSTVQIRVMEKQRPPIRVVIPGRVYRPDTHDDTHLSQFHQLEALVVDRGITMVDLKSTVLQFVKAYFGPDTQVRFRPSFFPFTEPSAECDVWFPDKQRWIELGGCGMVHPNVLTACNIDPETYTGWAFGFGIERIAMRKYGINNIRLFVENDVRFLGQF
jgi:phenylalanyl-tRNA synthetase alpha chain